MGLAGDVEIPIKANVKSAIQSLNNFRKTLYNSFNGSETKGLNQPIEQLNKSIKQTENTIKQLETSIEKTKIKLQELSQSSTPPKSVIAMEKELSQLEKQLAKTDSDFAKLSKEQADLANRQVPGLTLEQSLSPEQYARFQELDTLIIKNGEDTDKLNSRISELKTKLAEVKANPQLTDEGKKYNKELTNSINKLEEQKKKLVELKSQQEDTNNVAKQGTYKINNGFKLVSKTLNKIQTSIKRVFFFSVITKALRNLKNNLSALITGNSQLSASLNRLKSNLAVAFAPIWQICIPWIQNLLDALGTAAAAFAKFIAIVTNTDINKNMQSAQSNANTIATQKNTSKSTKNKGKTQEEKNIENQIKAIQKQNKELNKQKKLKEKERKQQEQANKKSLLAFDQLIVLDTKKSEEEIDALDEQIEKNDELIDQLQERLDLLQDIRQETTGRVTAPTLDFSDFSKKSIELPEFLANLAVDLGDFVFKPFKDLDSTGMANKLLYILNMIGGTILGWSRGGVVGAAFGLAISAVLTSKIVDVLFDKDGQMTRRQVAIIIASILTAFVVGAIVFKATNSLTGALVAGTITFNLTALLHKLNLGEGDDVGAKEISALVILSATIIAVAKAIQLLLKFFNKKDKGLKKQTRKTVEEKEAVEELSEAFENSAVPVSAFIPVLNGLGDSLEENIPALDNVTISAEDLIPALDAVTNSANANAPALDAVTNSANANAPALDAVTNSANANAPAFDFAASRALVYSTDVSEAVQTARTNVNTELSNMKNDIDTQTDTTRTTISSWATDTVGYYYDTFDNIITNSKIFVETVSTNLNELLSKSIKNVYNWAKAIAKNFANTFSNIITNARTTVTNVFNAFKALPNVTSNNSKNQESAKDELLNHAKSQLNLGRQHSIINIPQALQQQLTLAGVTGIAGGLLAAAGSLAILGLADGAVLPPNKPFLAMVGDQKHGTNVEAPLSTIQEALSNELDKRSNISNTNSDIIISLKLGEREFGQAVLKAADIEKARIGNKFIKTNISFGY